MTYVSSCLNEWNVNVEALGKGKQTVLIKKYNTSKHSFLLYPTAAYAKNVNVLDNFKDECLDFASDFLVPPEDDDGRFEVRYYARVVDVIKVPFSKLSGFSDFHIYSDDYVNSFEGSKNIWIWILRIYRLKNPDFMGKSRGARYSTVDCEVSVDDLDPIISEDYFDYIYDSLLDV